MSEDNNPASAEAKEQEIIECTVKNCEDVSNKLKKRQTWSSKFEFFLSTLGYAVGLGNIWRFPYLCYRNGGGAFFIPYVIMLVFVGMPIFLLEISLGQFTSQGPLTCWQYATFFRGLGAGMLLVSTFITIYYIILVAWAFRYLIYSFTLNLPWSKCGEWSTKDCVEKLLSLNNTACIKVGGNFSHLSQTCISNTTGKLIGIQNKTLAKQLNITATTPAEEFFEYVGVGWRHSPGLWDLGGLRYDLCLCSLAMWILVFLTLCKGIKSFGKVVYFTSLFPYVIMFVLLIYGLMQEGSGKGISFYLSPKMEKLREAAVWKDAAVQIFFSLSCTTGGLIALSSYNRFNTDLIRDTLTLTLSNCLTSFMAGLVVFSYLGYLAVQLNVEVEDVARKDIGLAFVTYPQALTLLPVPTLWSILFFIMMITVGLGTPFAHIETIVTSIVDLFPKLKIYKLTVIVVVCVIGFFLGLPMCTYGGGYLIAILDNYCGGWNMLIICILECVSIMYVYGANRFTEDIKMMVGSVVLCNVPWNLLRIWWKFCWCLTTPFLITFILVFSLIDYTGASFGFEGGIPVWGQAIGWMISFVTISSVLSPMIYFIIMAIKKRGSFCTTLSKSMTPNARWGPYLEEHRFAYAQMYTADSSITEKVFYEDKGSSFADANLRVSTLL